MTYPEFSKEDQTSAVPLHEKPMVFPASGALVLDADQGRDQLRGFAGLIGFFLKEFNNVLLWPLHHVRAENAKLNFDLGTTPILEGFNVVIQSCCADGFVMSIPF